MGLVEDHQERAVVASWGLSVNGVRGHWW